MHKTYIDAGALLRDSFRLAAQVYDSGFRPDFVIGIWRGGTPVGIALQEYFEYRGASTDHIAVRTSAYTGIEARARTVRVHGLHYIVEMANRDDALLVVDDVFDSGRSIEALLEALAQQMRNNLPQDIRIATPWFKPNNNETQLHPDYFVRTTEDWLVFPHELAGLTPAEILDGKADLAGIEDLFDHPQ